MKAFPSRTPSSTSLVDDRIRQTFGRLPLLVAFSVDQDLAFADVELSPCLGRRWSDAVYEEIMLELSMLIEDLDDAQTVEVLKGRTFARAVH